MRLIYFLLLVFLLYIFQNFFIVLALAFVPVSFFYCIYMCYSAHIENRLNKELTEAFSDDLKTMITQQFLLYESFRRNSKKRHNPNNTKL